MDILPSDDRRDRDDRRTLGRAVALGAVVAAYAVGRNPLNIDLGPFLPLYVGAASLVAAIAVVHTVCWSFGRPVVRAVVATIGTVAITYCTWIVAFFLLVAHDSDEEVLATRGAMRLVSVNGYNLIDPSSGWNCCAISVRCPRPPSCGKAGPRATPPIPPTSAARRR